jgi:hypothetical protein
VLWAIYGSVCHFPYMLEDKEFIIFTNHKPHLCPSPEDGAMTARQQRYLFYIAKYSSIIRHMAGQDKCMADLLSHPWGDSQQLRAVERKPLKVQVPSGSFVAVASTTGVSPWLSVCDEVCQSWSGCQLSGTAACETTKIKVPSRSLLATATTAELDINVTAISEMSSAGNCHTAGRSLTTPLLLPCNRDAHRPSRQPSMPPCRSSLSR